MDILAQIAEHLELGNDERVRDLTREAIDAGVPPARILDRGLIGGMNVVGEKFRVRDIFLPDVLLAAKAMYAGMDLVKPLLLKANIPTRGTVVIGSVHGDLHDIGKNLVGIMLKGAGFEVVDLGADVHAPAFVDAAVANGASIIGMSALLTTTMPVMKDVVDLVTSRGLRSSVKIMVGGAPVSADFAREIGADAYAFDAASAVDRARALVG
ncbi:MAG: corrinoid protein [Acidobacteria bacterium]|nr:corrinoid protein [Acidobacteriota bacterium]